MTDRPWPRTTALCGVALLLGMLLQTVRTDWTRPAEVAAEMAKTRGRTMPMTFAIEIDGQTAGWVRSFERVGEEFQVDRVRSGEERRSQSVLSDCRSFDLVLNKQPGDPGALFYNWWAACKNGQPQTKLVTVKLLDNAAKPVRVWELHDCLPRSWQVTLSSDLMPVETVVLTVGDIRMK